MWRSGSCLALGLGGLGGCASPDTELSSTREALAIEGPWRIADDVLALGDTQYVAYEGAGPWLGEEGCAGALQPGARLLGDALALHFPQVSKIGGYNCRPIRGTTETMSLHGAGRAVDVHIPTVGDALDADNDLGDQVGAFLVEHAELLGVQLVIWDQTSWGASRAVGAKSRDYTGVNPHHDHLHVELSVAAAARTDDWFSRALWPVEDAGSAAGRDAGAVVATDAGVTPDEDGGSIHQNTPPGDFMPHFPVRPVIEPVLDDDPMDEGDAGPTLVRDAAPVRGAGCALGHDARAPFVWQLALLALAARRVRRGR